MPNWFNRWNKAPVKTRLYEQPALVISSDSQDVETTRRDRLCLEDLRDYQYRNVTLAKGVFMPRDPTIGCSMSHIMAINKVLNRGFEPTILFENDARAEGSTYLHHVLNIPADADAVYIGISNCGAAIGATKHIHHTGGNFYSETSDPQIIRIYNMLATHAVFICSERMARNWAMCALEAATRNVPIDTMIARTHRYFNVYAVRTPLFYQSAEVGGQEDHTRVLFDGTLVKGPDDLPVLLRSFTPPCISADLAAL